MANRCYLYSASNRPTSYADRPETIQALCEWAYLVPFSFRVLLSGDPQLCASLVSDGLEDEPEADKTRIFALSSEFAPGFARLRKVCGALRILGRGVPELSTSVEEMLAFVEAHRDTYLLLETVELDMMIAEGEQPLRACVERELAECRAAGRAVDALPEDAPLAAAELARAAARDPGRPWWRWWQKASPLDALSGLVLDDGFDNTRDRKTEYPLGVSGWSGVLYYQLFNRAQFEAHRAEHGSGK